MVRRSAVISRGRNGSCCDAISCYYGVVFCVVALLLSAVGALVCRVALLARRGGVLVVAPLVDVVLGAVFLVVADGD